MSQRPLVSVTEIDGKSSGQVTLPAVFATPLRTDIVQTVHTNIAKNARQPYAVSRQAGMQSSAESWGTGRAVSRIPRVPGGGTHRAGQGAFGNMCRGGRMFAPLKIWRRWHRPVNIKQKRFAVSAAIAASGVPALLLARGHRISKLNEVPLVIPDSVESIVKAKKALEVLKAIGAYEDALKADKSKRIRSGKGKWRNRRYVLKKGPLLVYNQDSGLVKAFRNVPGVEVLSVDSLNLLKLAPGGHVGRFIIWTKSAFEKLDSIFGTFDKFSKQKGGWKLPEPQMKNVDLARIINSDEIQSAINPPKVPDQYQSYKLKKNAAKNFGTLLKLNPYAKTARRQQLKYEANRRANKDKIVKQKRAKSVRPVAHKFYQTMVKDSDYRGEDYDHFSTWLGTTV